MIQLTTGKVIQKLNYAIFPRAGGGGSSIVKVPGDVPPARVYFFKLSSLAKGIYFFAAFSPVSLGKESGQGKGMLLQIYVKEMSNFVNSCKEKQSFQILVQRMHKCDKFCLENTKSWHS